MPELRIQVSERVAELVRSYRISPEEVFETALRQELARRLPVLELTPRARKVLLVSREEAAGLGHGYVGTEHLLLGLIKEGEGLAAQVLSRLEVSDAVRAKLLEIMDSPEYRGSSRPPPEEPDPE